MGRPPCCDKSSVKRGLWTEEEDLKLIAYTNTHGIGNWTSVPKKAGLKRCGKSCRLRWTNYLRPNLKHESFTPQEEEMIITLHATIGSREHDGYLFFQCMWSIIANHLPGRTDNDIKNHWNTKLSKKLYQQGIDPVTHKPISQIMESIGSLSSATARAQLFHRTPPLDGRFSCLSRDLKNIFHPKPAAATLYDVGCSSNEASSSSSTAATAAAAAAVCQANADQNFKWSDFLAEDAFLSCTAQQQDEGSHSCQFENAKRTVSNGEGWGAMEDEVSSAAGSSSFVEAILDLDREMMMEFPEIFDHPEDLL